MWFVLQVSDDVLVRPHPQLLRRYDLFLQQAVNLLPAPGLTNRQRGGADDPRKDRPLAELVGEEPALQNSDLQNSEVYPPYTNGINF